MTCQGEVNHSVIQVAQSRERMPMQPQQTTWTFECLSPEVHGPNGHASHVSLGPLQQTRVVHIALCCACNWVVTPSLVACCMHAMFIQQLWVLHDDVDVAAEHHDVM